MAEGAATIVLARGPEIVRKALGIFDGGSVKRVQFALRESVRAAARRPGRVVEGTPLLREHAVKNCIEGSNPSVSAKWLLL